MAHLPQKHPTWLVKAMWRGTSVTLKIEAKTEEEAWDKAAKQVMKMLGGIKCMDIRVLGVTNA